MLLASGEDKFFQAENREPDKCKCTLCIQVKIKKHMIQTPLNDIT